MNSCQKIPAVDVYLQKCTVPCGPRDAGAVKGKNHHLQHGDGGRVHALFVQMRGVPSYTRDIRSVKGPEEANQLVPGHIWSLQTRTLP